MSILKRFSKETRGAVAPIFCLALLPMLAFVGAAVDYSRQSNTKSRLQAAVDSAALKLARDGRNATDAQLAVMAANYVNAQFQSPNSSSPARIAVSRTTEKIRITATSSTPVMFMQIAGFGDMPVATATEAAFGRKKIELALVLDNTGSMSRLNKMTELKRAVAALINDFEAMRPQGDEIRVSIVPFDTQVRADANTFRAASWLSYNPVGPLPFDTRVTQAAWGGCIVERGPNAADNNDVSERLPVPGFAETLHPAVACKAGLAVMRPLTRDWNALRATNSAMAPGGCTNITIGARWGLEMLSRGGPYTEAADYGASDIEKYMVILTDGDNTQNRWINGCSTPGDTTQIDNRTRRMCDEINERGIAVKQRNIKLFTVRVIDGNRTLLRDCATTPEMYKEVNDATQLSRVFREIFEAVTRVRISS